MIHVQSVIEGVRKPVSEAAGGDVVAGVLGEADNETVARAGGVISAVGAGMRSVAGAIGAGMAARRPLRLERLRHPDIWGNGFSSLRVNHQVAAALNRNCK